MDKRDPTGEFVTRFGDEIRRSLTAEHRMGNLFSAPSVRLRSSVKPKAHFVQSWLTTTEAISCAWESPTGRLLGHFFAAFR